MERSGGRGIHMYFCSKHNMHGYVLYVHACMHACMLQDPGEHRYRGHVSSVCTLDHFRCATSSYRTSRAFLGGKASFPGRILISFGFSGLPRAPAPLCDHGPTA